MSENFSEAVERLAKGGESRPHSPAQAQGKRFRGLDSQLCGAEFANVSS
jgi:hypothetical protein